MLQKFAGPGDLLPSFLLDDASTQQFIDMFKQRRAAGQNITPLHNLLAIYEKSPDEIFSDERFSHLLDRMKKPELKRRFNKILREFGSKPQAKASNVLLALGEEALQSKDPEKINEFLEKVPKSARQLRDKPKLRKILNRILAMRKLVRLYFREGTPSTANMKALAEALDGTLEEKSTFVVNPGESEPETVTEPSIVFQNLDSASALRKVLADKAQDVEFAELWRGKTKKDSGIRAFKPTILDHEVSEEAFVGLVQDYEANPMTAGLFAKFLKAINQSGGKVKQFIPKTLEDGNTYFPKEIVFESSSGGSLRTNAFFDLIVGQDIGGSTSWFETLLTQTRISAILPKKRIEDLIRQDLINAHLENQEYSTWFNILMPTMDLSPSASRKEISEVIDTVISIEEEGREAQSLLQQEFESTINNADKEVLEYALENLPEEDLEDLLDDYGLTELNIEPVEQYGIRRYVVRDDGDRVSYKILSKLLKDVSKEGTSFKEIYDKAQAFSNVENVLRAQTSFANLVLSTAISLHEKGSNLTKMVSEREGKLATISLTALNMQDFLAFVRVLDMSFVGPDHNIVGESYKRIDDLVDEDLEEAAKIAEKLEKSLSKLLTTYKEEILSAFESRLNELLEAEKVDSSLLNKLHRLDIIQVMT